MKNKNRKFTGFLNYFFVIITAICLAGVAFAEENSNEAIEDEIQRVENEFSDYFQTRFSQRLVEGKNRLDDIKNAMDIEYEKFNKSIESSREIEDKIRLVQGKLNDLKNQLENISLQLSNTEKKIQAIEDQIGIRKIDLEILYEEKEKIEAESDAQKQVVLNFFQALQKESTTRGDDEVKNTLRFLLADASFAEYLRNEMYLSSWEKTERQIFHNLELALGQLSETTAVVNKEKQRFEKLNEMIKQEKRVLAFQKTAKESLIKETKGEQDEYKKLWEKSRKEMFSSAESIKNLRANMSTIRQKLNVLEAQKRSQFDTIAKNDNADEVNYEVGKIFEAENSNKTPFAWPIEPLGGVTAYFHDDTYFNIFSMTHEAIDIRSPQGAEIHAPALGYVYEVADNGNGYSYLIIAHSNNLITVYGHVSKFLVQEGDIVQEGDVLGLTGGTPGTKGAGVMTTGPHLHFEVIDDGENQDPLKYLPLEKLPIEYIPEEYLMEQRF